LTEYSRVFFRIFQLGGKNSEENMATGASDCGCAFDLGDLRNMLAAESARAQQANTNAFQATLSLMELHYVKLLGEADPVQAAAVRQMMHREAPIDHNAPA